jgi:hypothetical protein
MIKSDKKFREFSEIFKEKNSLHIATAIVQMREEQPFEGGIGLLTELFDSNPDPSVRKAVAGLMNDLKDQAATKEVISEVKKRWKSETRTMLVSSCWQSGLDYKKYLTDLAIVFMESDYATALECFTVIEESAEDIDMTKKDEIIQILAEKSPSQTNERKTLTSELLVILRK